MIYDWIGSVIVPFQVFWYYYDYVFSDGIFLALKGLWDGGSPVRRGRISRRISLNLNYMPVRSS